MNENEMTALMLQLADLGVRGIVIKYAGEGDSGSIEEIQYTTTEVNNPDELDIAWDAPNLKDISPTIVRKIEDFAYSKLLQDVEDWYNNEGGYGTISILVPSGQYVIDNNVRIVDYNCYQHEGSLIEKSVE